MVIAQQGDTFCGHLYPDGTRCTEQGKPCWLPGWTGQEAPEDEGPYEYLCSKHMFQGGYCPGCGVFWAGIESFEFSPLQLCDDCTDEMEAELAQEEETYSTYPFDSEDDWHEDDDYES